MEKKILLIDDDQSQLQIFSEALQEIDSNSNCIFARSAQMAFKTLTQVIPDYIFINMHLPQINGLACIVKIRELKYLSTIPVFLYSASFDDTIKEMALGLGATSCIRKPYTVKVLTQVLRKIISADDRFGIIAVRTQNKFAQY